MKISKGFATWAGSVGALGGFLLALATFMDTFDQLDPLAGLGPLAAAAGVLYKVIDGRMKQATALASRPSAPPTAPVTVTASTSTTGWTQALTDVVSGEIGGRLGLGLRGKTRALGEPTDLSLEIPGGGFPQDGERP